MPVIPSREDSEGPHTSSWITLNTLCDLYSIREVSHCVRDDKLLLKPHLHAAIRGAAERGKTEYFRIMFVREIVDPAKDRHVWIHFILGRNVHEAVIFNVEIRASKV